MYEKRKCENSRKCKSAKFQNLKKGKMCAPGTFRGLPFSHPPGGAEKVSRTPPLRGGICESASRIRSPEFLPPEFHFFADPRFSGIYFFTFQACIKNRKNRGGLQTLMKCLFFIFLLSPPPPRIRRIFHFFIR